ncbi:hypothetical protein FW778_14345 [Ginsengibacter hankyongi]|uniref:Uncharacterized protein n=1 Tax=Ginsengibacter hankyongi TaxID=2607284 RepID=A0A5J5IFR4_9BACT|nr:hypothetical protein [Ginsengibacter hankyongi]KAA9038722.1 hypothetical protein FW778_14345 [Ginsengibacter hankyongi]
MITIKINEFKGYGLEEFTLFLKESEDNVYEIIVPKKTVAGTSANADIAWEYFTAAYIGRQLYEISSEFCYTAATPKRKGEFGFHITARRIEQLAGLLFQASGAFGNAEVAEPVNFTLEVGAFITYFKDKPTVCQDLLDIGKEYHCDK